MPLEHLRRYEQYTAEHGLPLWRIEVQLAQLCMLVDAQRRPGADLSLADYLIRPQQARSTAPAAVAEQPATDQEAEAIAAAIGFAPRKKRRTDPTETPAAAP